MSQSENKMDYRELDPKLSEYLKLRANVSDADIRLHLREVGFHCPLCGKDLQMKRQKKRNVKLFEIAHIYPNRPTKQQYEELKGLERLGVNSESFDNKIALCKDCHSMQDYHTSKEDYINLLNIKKNYLKKSTLSEVTNTLNLESYIEMLINLIVNIKTIEQVPLNYCVVSIDKKFENNERLLKAKIRGYVTEYYTFIRDLFQSHDNKSNFDGLSRTFKFCFQNLNDKTNDKIEIFNALVDWLNNETLNNSKEACEAIISFFVQECEVFNEITK